MTKKASCHLPFNVERGVLGARKGTMLKYQFRSADTLPFLTSDRDTDNYIWLPE